MSDGAYFPVSRVFGTGPVDEEDPNGPFPEVLRLRRTRAGLTQQALADLSTVSPRTIRSIESGRTNARVQTIHLLADALRLQGPMREVFVRAGLSRHRTRSPGPRAEAAARRSNGLFGRDREVRALVAALGSGNRRMVSIVGLPGVGKTRLAAEIAVQLNRLRGWPVLWVGPAAPAGGQRENLPATVVPAVRASLELGSDSLEQVRRLVGRHEAVLVLDGSADASLPSGVEDLLLSCPGLRAVSTSREPWHVRGVQPAVILPLPTPGREWEAERCVETLARVPSVGLLVERFSELAPTFVLDHTNADDVVRLVRRLDGLPLAVEAMAVRFRLLGVGALAELPTPDLLAVTVPTRSAGSTTLGGLFRSCVERLGSAHRRTLLTLAGWDDGWTVVEAAVVLGRSVEQVMDDLDLLTCHGLVVASGDGRSMRLRLPNLLRAVLLRQAPA